MSNCSYTWFCDIAHIILTYYMNICSYKGGNSVKIKKLSEEMCYDLSDFFRIFGDSTRIKILYSLFQGEMCVSELVNQLGMNQSAVSHQLRLLRQNDIVKFRKDGQSVIYSLDDDHVSALLAMGIEHIVHKNGYEEGDYNE